MTNDDLDDLVDQWHDSPDDGVSLQQFLGMTDEEFDPWARDATIPERMR